MHDLDWESLKPELFNGRRRTMFDVDFSRALGSIPPYPGYDPSKIVNLFLNTFEAWLYGSRLNRLTGLEKFPVRHVIAGVTHSLDDMHIRHGDNLVILHDEYYYHHQIKPGIKVKRPEALKKGDVLVLSVPFMKYGGLHPLTPQILQLAQMLKVPVHIDAAGYGCLRGFEFNFDHPAIQSISFSLSKGLGLGGNRIGVRYARERLPGPVSEMHDKEMIFEIPMWTGIHFIKRFGSDWLQTKYEAAYNLVCEKYGLKKSNAIHLAFAETGETWTTVGLRPFLTGLVEGRNEFENRREIWASAPQASI